MVNFEKWRRGHWGVVLLCFFLPAVEGCDKKIIYPYLDVLNPDRWLQTVVFLYPVLLVLIAVIIFKALRPAGRFAVSWAVNYLLFILISWLVFMVVHKMSGNYGVLLTGLWGITAFGLLRCRHENQLADLTGFILTALALWFFPFAFLFSEKILYGGWLYIYASGFVLLSYVVEWGLRRKN